jgi:hypothetical protein
MILRDIVERLQQDLIESPREKPKNVRKGNELKFVRRFLADWGYNMPSKKIHDLAERSQSYELFMRSATN